jgi:hypothetical protein
MIVEQVRESHGWERALGLSVEDTDKGKPNKDGR